MGWLRTSFICLIDEKWKSKHPAGEFEAAVLRFRQDCIKGDEEIIFLLMEGMYLATYEEEEVGRQLFLHCRLSVPTPDVCRLILREAGHVPSFKRGWIIPPPPVLVIDEKSRRAVFGYELDEEYRVVDKGKMEEAFFEFRDKAIGDEFWPMAIYFAPSPGEGPKKHELMVLIKPSTRVMKEATEMTEARLKH